VDPRLLDVLHDGADVGVAPVAKRIDVDLDRVLEEAVDQQPPAARPPRTRPRRQQMRMLRPPSTYEGRTSTG
jgi:hypothetical protein